MESDVHVHTGSTDHVYEAGSDSQMQAITSGFTDDRRSGCSTVRLFGTQYFHAKTSDGGDLWLTDWGWPWKEHLSPEAWYRGGQYTKHGARLGYSTGCVYKLVVSAGARRLAFVVKISRVAQPVITGGLLPSANAARTSFSSPFEEIGQLNLLRASNAPREYLFTKRPLGVFSPGARVPSWMFDRIPHEFTLAARRLAADGCHYPSDDTSRLEPDRDYLTLFSWVVGYNLEELVALGRISIDEMKSIDLEVRLRLERLGFVVTDHKPNHVIVRLDEGGVPLRRRGRLVVALADFELLEQSATRAR